MSFDFSGLRVWVAGAGGQVGSALVRRLQSEDCTILSVSHSECDLTNQAATRDWMLQNKPDAVFIAAAKVGGIHANNSTPADFLYENIMIETNIIHQCHLQKVKKTLFLGSSCIYPKNTEIPIREDALLTGSLEPTNEAYAIAKITGIKMCAFYRKQYGDDFISAMPSNLYGINDNFDLEKSHVLPALIRKFHEAKKKRAKAVSLWGDGRPLREFLFVDDLADACVFLMKNYSDGQHINVGSGHEISIENLAKQIAQIVGFEGEIQYDTTKPNGTMRKTMDNSRIEQAGWKARTSLQEGIEKVYAWFQANETQYRS
ncbi:MAG: GDP-L-fucose synthase family protein [Candidatus Oxydemutatoraceae bacterium WSBS_2016_MAG_OTU14]